MITVILLAALAMVGLVALLVYKSLGRRARTMDRSSEARASGASVGRATGGQGDN